MILTIFILHHHITANNCKRNQTLLPLISRKVVHINLMLHKLLQNLLFESLQFFFCTSITFSNYRNYIDLKIVL